MIDKNELQAIKRRTEGQWHVADTVDSDIPGVQYLSYDVWTIRGMAGVYVFTPDEGAITVGRIVHHMVPTDEMADEFRARGLKSIFDTEEGSA